MSVDRIRGAMLGGAIGDALGVPISGADPDAIRAEAGPVTGYRRPHPKVLPGLRELGPGMWGGPTQLSLVTADTLVRCNGPDPGELSVALVMAFAGNRRGWDNTTRGACKRLNETIPREESGNPLADDGGLAARAAPLGIWADREEWDDETLWEHIEGLGTMTHRHPVALAGAYMVASSTRAAVAGEASLREVLVARARWIEERLSLAEPLYSARYEASPESAEGLDLYRAGHGAGESAPEQICWAHACVLAHGGNDFRGVVLAAVNGAEVPHQAGAIAGVLAGAIVGEGALPRDLLEPLEGAGRIRRAADALGGRR